MLLELRWDNAAGVITPFVPKGWRNHPAVLMWRGHEAALTAYQDATCEEWTLRGFNDTCKRKTRGLLAAADRPDLDALTLPPWLGDHALHLSHQSNLVRKDPDVYGPRFPGVPSDLDYVWPVAAPPTP